MKRCIVTGCRRRTTGRLCPAHAAWHRGRYHGIRVPLEELHDLTRFRRPKRGRGKPWKHAICEIPGCDRKPKLRRKIEGVVRELCHMHGQRADKCPDKLYVPGKLIEHTGDPRMYRGYRFLRIDGKRIPEHRYVVEQAIGRKLTSVEHVHHKNGRRHDNRLENLMILSNAEHKLLHYRIGWRIHEFSLDSLKQLRADLNALIAKMEPSE